MGSIGCVRSSAWISDLASTNTTTSPYGGFTENEILNVPCRHGLRPFSRHNRDTDVCNPQTPSVFVM